MMCEVPYRSEGTEGKTEIHRESMSIIAQTSVSVPTLPSKPNTSSFAMTAELNSETCKVRLKQRP